MHDLIIITSYNRPDYLRLCLEYLFNAEGIFSNKVISLDIDRGKSLIREFYEVIYDFPLFRFDLPTYIHWHPEHTFHGNSYNTLEAYKRAYGTEARFVYLIEDDVLVMPDFFKWHEAAQNEGDFMCSIAYRCRRNSLVHKDVGDPAAYLTSSQDYASIGVCWKREKLAPIVEHAKEEYYRNLGGYLKLNFPNNRFSDCFTEQDGLIMRVMGETHGNTIWPFVPRAYHVGFAGYNRPCSARLSYKELKETIYDEQKIKAADKDFGDIEVVPTSVPKWNKLYCAQVIN